MGISDDMLMAYADGEFDLPDFWTERAAVETAIKTDPALARRIDQHRALRQQLGGLYSDVLQMPVPDLLVATIRAAPSTQGAAVVTDLNAVRANRRTTPAARMRARLSLNVGRAMAASLVVGVTAGYLAFGFRESGPMSMSGGQLIAQASLDQALSNQMASGIAQPAAVRIGLSFKAKSGAYCRTFMLQRREALGGLACRQGEVWRVQMLAQVPADIGSAGGYQQAGSGLPAALRAAVEEQMAGEPLDANAETQARQHHWK